MSTKIPIIIDISKPIKDRVDKKQGGLFSKLIVKAAQNPLLLDKYEFANYVENGCTFCSSIFKGERKNENYISTQMLCFDVDSFNPKTDPDKAHMPKIDYYDFIERLAQYNIYPTFCYKTPSCGLYKNPNNPDIEPLSRYRVVILLNDVITDHYIIKKIYTAFGLMFAPIGEFDTSCSDSNRFFYGGIASKDPLLPLYDSMLISEINGGFTEIDSVIEVCDSFLCKSGDKNPFRNTIKFYINGKSKVDKKCGNRELSHVYISDNTLNPQKITNTNGTINSNNKEDGGAKMGLRKIDITKACEYLVCMRDLISGDVHHCYNNLRIIACSLVNVDNGIAQMREAMERTNTEGKTHYSTENGDWGLLSNISSKYSNYKPADLVNLIAPKNDPTRYDSDKQYKNILSVFSESLGTRLPCSETQPLPKYTLESTQNFIQEKLDWAKENGIKKVLYITPCGFGKTTFIKTRKEGTIAFQTHALKDEFIKDAFNGELPEKVIQTIKLNIKSFDNEDIAKKIQAMYDAGLYSDVRELCNSLMADDNTSVNDSSLIASWLSSCEIFAMEHTRNYLKLTTHAYALHGENPTDILYIDEDPTFEIFKTREMNLSSFTGIDYSQSILKDEFAKAGAFLLSLGHDQYVDTPAFFKDLNCEETKKLIRKKLQPNIFPIFDSDYLHCRIEEVIKDGKIEVIRKISYIKKVDLPDVEMLVIFSATANEDLAKHIWGDDVVVFNLSNIDLTGEIHQIYHTGSKTAIKKDIEYLDIIPKNDTDLRLKQNAMKLFGIVGNPHLVTITSIEMRSILKERGMENISDSLHFGNESGTNVLSGSNGCVLGCMILPEHIMGLMFKAIYMKDVHKDYFNIEKGWYSKYGEKVKTYIRSNKEMQELYMWIKSISLIQAVGRFRLLRLDAVAAIAADIILPFRVKYYCSLDKFDLETFVNLVQVKVLNKLNSIEDNDDPCLDCLERGEPYHKLEIIEYNDGLGDNPF